MSEGNLSIRVANTDDFYYITSSYHYYHIDEKVAILIDMEKEEYKKLMQMKFNASEWHNIMVFFDKKDAENAFEYLSSLLLVKRLVE